jgi:glycosyltransferase involved in cell wall biosynthesis
MSHALDSLLTLGAEAEILVVNDGSSDRTGEIAHTYAEQYPHMVRVIDQPNGGHGDAIMTGLKAASGTYFKVVDSDDWIDAEAGARVIARLREFAGPEDRIDMLISNYVYEKPDIGKRRCMHYRGALPQNEVFSWDDIDRFHIFRYILMHSVIYRTELLRKCGLDLPKHTFYVDNIYVYTPLPSVNRLCYLDVDFYRYFIGRADQSVNERVMIARVDQQIAVTKIIIDRYEMEQIGNRKLRRYMQSYIAIMMAVSSIILIRSATEESLRKKKELWGYLREKQPAVFFRIRYGILGQCINLPRKEGRRISVLGYKLAQRVIGFN